MILKNYHPFTIVCPVCHCKQTGFVRERNYAKDGKAWGCIVKGCVGWLNADEIDEHVQLTVGDIKTSAK